MGYPDGAKFGLYGGMWVKLQFQLPYCFKISCRRTRTRFSVEQKNPVEHQTSALVPNRHFLLRFLDVFTSSDHKRLTTAVQFDSDTASYL
jgi:hypothetical protein